MLARATETGADRQRRLQLKNAILRMKSSFGVLIQNGGGMKQNVNTSVFVFFDSTVLGDFHCRWNKVPSP
jgi:hypothetical protein